MQQSPETAEFQHWRRNLGVCVVGSFTTIVAMTLLLPKLGEVDARLSATGNGNGWDINLRFAPQALLMMAPHQERCRESLRRRLACQVRLRFEQRGGQA